MHIQRWANGLSDEGLDVVCASQHEFLPTGWSPKVKCIRLSIHHAAGYVFNAPELARLFKEERCDLLNAHYATGYGTMATLSRVRRRMISVWGSDIYEFPHKSFLHAGLVRWVLSTAQGIGSTSLDMAQQVRLVMGNAWKGSIDITPFGVEMDRFVPSSLAHTQPSPSSPLVIGTVKTLAPKYGIDILLKGFAQLLENLPDECADHVTLRIVGGGHQEAELKSFSRSLGIKDKVEFVGKVAHADVPHWLQTLDVFVAVSRQESFGVAVIEASACELPVVVSRVGGLPEVVDDQSTGFIIAADDPQQLALALQKLVADAGLRQQMGQAGRAKVQTEYEWRHCVRLMVKAYQRLMA